MVSDLEALWRRVLGHPSATRGRGASPQAIEVLEARIGALPDDYRQFLARWGWLSVGAYEILGLGGGVASHQDAGLVTLAERAEYGLPDRYVVIMNNGAGDLYCLDVASTPSTTTAPVVVWLHETQEPEPRAPSFASFLAELLLGADEHEP
jgi:hypothetical protein